MDHAFSMPFIWSTCEKIGPHALITSPRGDARGSVSEPKGRFEPRPWFQWCPGSAICPFQPRGHFLLLVTPGWPRGNRSHWGIISPAQWRRYPANRNPRRNQTGSCIWLRDGLASLTLLLLRAVKYIFGADQSTYPHCGQMKNSVLQMQPKPFIGTTLLMPAVTGGFLGQG